MKSDVLPEFQEYLRSKSLVNEKHIAFYAHWASKFQAFSKSNNNFSHEVRVLKFTDYLKSNDNIADWQVRQADNAIQLYVQNFRDNRELGPHTFQQQTSGPAAISKIIEDMRQALRIKHYAYRTELAYLECVEKFFNYTMRVKKKDLKAGLNSDDVREYLSYLALTRNVAASTQNQALL